MMKEGFPGGSEVKASACNAGDLGSIPGSGRYPGEGTGNPLQYSCLENLMDGEAWWATVHGVAKSWTGLSNFTFTFMMIELRCLISSAYCFQFHCSLLFSQAQKLSELSYTRYVISNGVIFSVFLKLPTLKKKVSIG